MNKNIVYLGIILFVLGIYFLFVVTPLAGEITQNKNNAILVGAVSFIIGLIFIVIGNILPTKIEKKTDESKILLEDIPEQLKDNSEHKIPIFFYIFIASVLFVIPFFTFLNLAYLLTYFLPTPYVSKYGIHRMLPPPDIEWYLILPDIVALILLMAITFFGLYIGIILLLKKRNALSKTKSFLYTYFYINLLILIWSFTTSGNSDSLSVVLENIFRLIPPGIYSVIWLSYIRYSKKVKHAYSI
jgi:hypothetical protein